MGRGRRANDLPASRVQKTDTRRNILAGAFLLAWVESGDFDSRTFKRWLDQALAPQEGLKLFGLWTQCRHPCVEC